MKIYKIMKGEKCGLLIKVNCLRSLIFVLAKDSIFFIYNFLTYFFVTSVKTDVHFVPGNKIGEV